SSQAGLLLLLSAAWRFCPDVRRWRLWMNLSIWRAGGVSVPVLGVVIPASSCFHLVHDGAQHLCANPVQGLLRVLYRRVRGLVRINDHDRSVSAGCQHRGIGYGVDRRGSDDDVVKVFSESS